VLWSGALAKRPRVQLALSKRRDRYNNATARRNNDLPFVAKRGNRCVEVGWIDTGGLAKRIEHDRCGVL
jgi:hypothetical protein